MKIFLAGGTGFLGRCLVPALEAEGHEITVLVRHGVEGRVAAGSARTIRGDPTVAGPWQQDLAGHDVVINLAGASIFQPWTKKARREIRESRIRSTENVVDAIRQSAGVTRRLFNASGVGYYGLCGDAAVDERHPPGDTFLAGVARLWEEAALRAGESGAGVVLCRLGIVLGGKGGAFRRILPLVQHGFGAAWGRGGQWFSWIHEKDVVRIFAFLLDREDIVGPLNFVSPAAVTNREMMDTLNGLLGKRPYVRAIPGWIIRSLAGEFSTVFMEGRRVIPRALKKEGFAFAFPSFRGAAADLIPGFTGRR